MTKETESAQGPGEGIGEGIGKDAKGEPGLRFAKGTDPRVTLTNTSNVDITLATNEVLKAKGTLSMHPSELSLCQPLGPMVEVSEG